MNPTQLRVHRSALPDPLSAGEQRRMAIAAVLASRPQALLLDEPTAGQDAGACATLRALLGECAAGGLAIAVATHDPFARLAA